MNIETMDEIKIIAAAMQKTYNMAYNAYLPIVTDLCERKASQNEVEHTLDYLLDFACDERCLKLFKKLCRKYFPLYPQCIADYIGFYRELWDTPNDQSDGK